MEREFEYFSTNRMAAALLAAKLWGMRMEISMLETCDQFQQEVVLRVDDDDMEDENDDDTSVEDDQ